MKCHFGIATAPATCFICWGLSVENVPIATAGRQKTEYSHSEQTAPLQIGKHKFTLGFLLSVFKVPDRQIVVQGSILRAELQPFWSLCCYLIVTNLVSLQ